MVTPPLQSSLLALEQGNPGEDAVRFHGRNICHLPAEVLPGITRYLSVREVLVLGQVCCDLRNNLQRCGVITDVWNYLSLPKNVKRSIPRLVTGNRLLIDQLRNNPVGYSKSFPIQHGPAIYTKYASYLRERTVRASSVTLMLSGRINELSDWGFCKLNRQHNCLIMDGYKTGQLQIWTNQKDGSWKKECMIQYEPIHDDSRPNGTDILFVGKEEDGEILLSIIERNEQGEWNVTQELPLNEILPSLENHYIVDHIYLAENQRVALFKMARNINNGVIIIFCPDSDGRWLPKGELQFCHDIDDFQFRYSQNCGHVAVYDSEMIVFVSEKDDGTWIKTGEIESESEPDHKNLEFSADDHHFVAWGQKYVRSGNIGATRRESHVLVASLDDQGHWPEVLRIKRVCGTTAVNSRPYARFSPDGKHLFACINNELIILGLHDGKWVSSTHLLEPWDGRRCKINTTMDPSLFMVASGDTGWIYAIDVHGVWGKQHEFSYHSKFAPRISPDGNTVISLFDGADWYFEVWSRRHADRWIEQKIDLPADRAEFSPNGQAEFSPDGSLVALDCGYDLILLGLTEENQWQKKGRQKLGLEVADFSFSPCGRSIRVNFHNGEDRVITFWQIVLQEDS